MSPEFQAQVERTLATHDRLLAQHAKFQEEHERNVQELERSRQEHQRWLQEHEQELERSRQEHQRWMQEHQRKMERLDARIKHGIRLAVNEARAERAKRRELDEKLTQLAASHILTEEALRDLKTTVDSFIQSLRRGGNGHIQA